MSETQPTNHDQRGKTIPMPNRPQQPIPPRTPVGNNAGLADMLAPLLSRLQQSNGGSDPATAVLATGTVEELRFLREEVKFWRERTLKLEEREPEPDLDHIEKLAKGRAELLKLVFMAENVLLAQQAAGVSMHDDAHEFLELAAVLKKDGG